MLKAHTFGSLALVAIGQGVLAFADAWAAIRGGFEGLLSVEGSLGAVCSALLILALYPLTQFLQVEEDAAREDRTLAVAWGPQVRSALCQSSSWPEHRVAIHTSSSVSGTVQPWLVTLSPQGQSYARRDEQAGRDSVNAQRG